jgi:hypothetical protein
MRLLQRAFLLLPAGLLIVASTSVFAQARDDKQEADRQKNETAITGCLTKDASGGYTLADEKTGVKLTVAGPSDLEKHSANHKVTLTGTTKTDTTGKSVFEVTKIQHIAADCKAPSQ